MRKINAVFGLLTTVLLLIHAICLSVRMLSRYRIDMPDSPLPWVLTALMTVHMVLCIILWISSQKDANGTKHKEYFKLNAETYVQRITGLLIILLIVLHVLGAANHFQPKMLHAILHPLFFAAALAHVSVSFSRAFISLGIGNAKAIRIIDVSTKALCCVIFAAGVIGFNLCLFLGVAV